MASFKNWLREQPQKLVATVSHFGTVNAMVNHEPCVEASGMTRQAAEQIAANPHAWKLGVLPHEGGVRVGVKNCGFVRLVYEEVG